MWLASGRYNGGNLGVALIGIKSQPLKPQVHVSHIILKSLNLVLKLIIVVSQSQF